MKAKTTKRAFLTSLMALFLCFTMLLGTTFAWFTDTASSEGNKIVAGSLDVNLLMYDEFEGDYIDISSTKAPIFGTDEVALNSRNTLWEPGKTQVAYLAIENAGSLDLKYQVYLTVTNKTGDLYEVFRYTITPDARGGGAAPAWDADNSVSVVPGVQEATAGFVTLANRTTHYFALSLHMLKDAGNEYQGGEIMFDITVRATQVASEEDSFGNDYDEDAALDQVAVSSLAQLKQAIAAGNKNIAIVGEIDLAGSAITANGVTFVGATADAALDFGIYSIAGEGNTFCDLSLFGKRTNANFAGDGWYNGMGYGSNNTTYINCVIENGYTSYGNATFKDCTFNELPAGNYALFLYSGAEFAVENCVFYYGNRAIKIYNEGGAKNVTMSIANTTFKATATSVPNKAMIEIDDTFMDSVSVTVKNITVDNALADKGVYRINDGALDTSTAKSTVTVNGVSTLVADGVAFSNDTYYVSTGAGFAYMNSHLVGVKRIEIVADIDMTGYTWNSFNLHQDFGAVLTEINGKGHIISNLKVSGALFSNIALRELLTVKDITFADLTVVGGSKVALIGQQLYTDVLLDNVDVIGATITGEQKVATLVNTVFDEHATVATLTVKNCDIKNVTLTATSNSDNEERLCGLVCWVADKYDNEEIVLENNKMENVSLISHSAAIEHHAIIYMTDRSASSRYGVYHNEDDGVTVINCSYTNINIPNA